MARALEGTTIEVLWSGTSFLLASTVVQPVIGSLSHIFGRKPMMYISLAFFLLGSIVAALANGFDIAIVGRSFQGVGGGGIIALTWIVITDMVPLKERARCKFEIQTQGIEACTETSEGLSLVSAVWAIGTVGGPILGMPSLSSKSMTDIYEVAASQKTLPGDGSSGSTYPLLALEGS
jgi:MFS family permease